MHRLNVHTTWTVVVSLHNPISATAHWVSWYSPVHYTTSTSISRSSSVVDIVVRKHTRIIVRSLVCIWYKQSVPISCITLPLVFALRHHHQQYHYYFRHWNQQTAQFNDVTFTTTLPFYDMTGNPFLNKTKNGYTISFLRCAVFVGRVLVFLRYYSLHYSLVMSGSIAAQNGIRWVGLAQGLHSERVLEKAFSLPYRSFIASLMRLSSLLLYKYIHHNWPFNEQRPTRPSEWRPGLVRFCCCILLIFWDIYSDTYLPSSFHPASSIQH